MNSHFDGREGLDVIDAFVDGERVNPRDLKRALAEPVGRDYFVDAWMLREGVQEDRESRAVELPPLPIAPRRAVQKWLVAAALAVGVAGGYLAGHRTSPSSAPLTTPARTPVTAASGPSGSAGASTTAVFPAPQPTRVIQLEFQLDAKTSGGD